MYKYIINPKNNKSVSILTKKGLDILKKYLIQSGGFTVPVKYIKGLTKKEVKRRTKRLKEGSKTSHKDPKAYRDFKTDFRKGKRIQTKTSNYTQKWKKYFNNADSLSQKSDKTGVPLQILKKVYNKGLAAWRTGHRPGATPQQWGYARVHSFLVKGKTFYTTDKKLGERAMKIPKAKKWFNSL